MEVYFQYPKQSSTDSSQSLGIFDYDSKYKSIDQQDNNEIDSIIIKNLKKYKLNYLYFLIKQNTDISSKLYSEYLKTYTKLYLLMNQFTSPSNSIINQQNKPILHTIIMKKHCKVESTVIMNYLLSIIDVEETNLLIKNVLRIINFLIPKNYSNNYIVTHFFINFIHHEKIRNCLYDFDFSNFLEIKQNSYIFLLLEHLDLSSEYYQRDLLKLYNFIRFECKDIEKKKNIF